MPSQSKQSLSDGNSSFHRAVAKQNPAYGAMSKWVPRVLPQDVTRLHVWSIFQYGTCKVVNVDLQISKLPAQGGLENKEIIAAFSK